jgi:hypothetical protein
MHVVYTLSLFLISPFCCCSLSRYKKVPQERYTRFFLILPEKCGDWFGILKGKKEAIKGISETLKRTGKLF